MLVKLSWASDHAVRLDVIAHLPVFVNLPKPVHGRITLLVLVVYLQLPGKENYAVPVVSCVVDCLLHICCKQRLVIHHPQGLVVSAALYAYFSWAFPLSLQRSDSNSFVRVIRRRSASGELSFCAFSHCSSLSTGTQTCIPLAAVRNTFCPCFCIRFSFLRQCAP